MIHPMTLASDITAKPIKAPTIACVPDTGILIKVANDCQQADPIIADNMPTMRTVLSSLKTSISNNSFRMVSPTRAPINTAPPVSNKVARIQAVRIEIVFAPTVVPKEFATSFAPMAQARKNAMQNEITT